MPSFSTCARTRGLIEGVELIFKFIERWMGVKLRISRGQMRQQAADVGFVHARILQQAKDGFGVPDARPGQGGAGPRAKAMERWHVAAAVGPVAGGQRAGSGAERIEGQAQAFDSQLGRRRHEDAEDRRVQVQVQMAVDVVERQAGGAEPLKLRVNLRAAMARAVCAERNSGSRRRPGSVVNSPLRFDQPGNAVGAARRE